MNVIAINGSPRINWNTHTLLQKALEGAASQGAKTELYNLYELNYKGCIGCLECKRNDSVSIGKCAIDDDLKPLYEKIETCDALILGSPIYFSEVTGEMRSFLERLFFQYLSYEKESKPYFGRRIQTGFIFTMNAPESILDKIGFTDKVKAYAALVERLLGPTRTLISTETLQIEDYSKYGMSGISEAERKQRRESVFPDDCQKAYDLGVEIALMAKSLIVALDGSGGFTSVQAAVDSLGSDGGEIFIKNGVYEEKIRVTTKNITLIGEDSEKTVLTYGDGAKKLTPEGEEYGTFRSYSFYIGADDFTAINIRFVNSAGPGKDAGQALAMYTDGDRIAFYNCAFIGYQDTLFTSPLPQKPTAGGIDTAPGEYKPVAGHRTYFKDCYIRGDVDFIFGGATAYFDCCEIFSNDRSMETNGYITAASTPENQKWGYVFNRCRLVGDCCPDSVYLGRPWRNHAHVAFISCYMDAHIKKVGWHNWSKPEAEQSARYEEYASEGPGGDVSGRADWSRLLTDAEAALYTAENVLGGEDGWKP